MIALDDVSQLQKEYPAWMDALPSDRNPEPGAPLGSEGLGAGGDAGRAAWIRPTVKKKKKTARMPVRRRRPATPEPREGLTEEGRREVGHRR